MRTSETTSTSHNNDSCPLSTESTYDQPRKPRSRQKGASLATMAIGKTFSLTSSVQNAIDLAFIQKLRVFGLH